MELSTVSGDRGRYQETGRESEDGKRETGNGIDGRQVSNGGRESEEPKGCPDKHYEEKKKKKKRRWCRQNGTQHFANIFLQCP